MLYIQANFRLKSIVTTGGLQDLHYTYDAVGNVRTMDDNVGGLDLIYTYDELDRLTGVSGSYGRTYSYNTIGNLEVKNGLTLYYEDADHPHAVSSTSEGWAFDYSATGNLITKTVGGQVVTFGYDAENRLTEVISGTVTTFVYDGDGRRVKKVDGDGTTVYIGEHYELRLGQAGWGTDMALGQGTEPAIAADGTGHVYVTWRDGEGGNGAPWWVVYLARSSDNGENWNVEALFDYSEHMACEWTEPDIAVDEESNLYMVWAGCPDYGPDIYFRRSTDGGESWGPAVKVNDDAGTSEQREPAIAVDGAGRIYVVWTDRRGGDDDIYFAYSSDGGQTWSTNVRVNDDGGTEAQRYPDVAVDAAGNVYVVWEDTRNSAAWGCDVYFARRDANGLWGQNVRINRDSGAADQLAPSIGVDGANRVHIVWADRRSGSSEVYSIRSPDGGGNWEAELVVSGVGEPGLWPSVAVEEEGDAYAVWVSGSLYEYDVVSARLDVGGVAWRSCGRVNGERWSVGDGFRPVVAVDGEGRVYAAWVDWRSGRDEVYFSRLSEQGESSVTKHYYANGRRLATRVDGTLYYVHQDHLGSTVALSDAAGQAVGRVQYDPYGEVITSTLPITLTDRLFTGQRFDSSTGLYYYNARYYDPHLGRFIQPDTLVPDPLNPQAWNRFSYVYNNPTNYVDPTGHIGFWDILDVGSFLWSSYDLYREPSWANLGWWALDVIGLLPLIPSLGLLRHGDEAADLLRAAGRVEDVGDAIRYAPRSSGHHRALQRAIVEALDEGEIVAFRGMEWGWGTWARKGWDIPHKPGYAKKTLWKGPKGLRLTEKGLFITDLDAAWALSRSGMMDEKTFKLLRGAINKAYGKDIVLHGHHWQGLRDLVKGVYAIDQGKDYIRATVYVYGKNIHGVTGFLGSGPALDMYRQYHRVLVP